MANRPMGGTGGGTSPTTGGTRTNVGSTTSGTAGGANTVGGIGTAGGGAAGAGGTGSGFGVAEGKVNRVPAQKTDEEKQAGGEQARASSRTVEPTDMSRFESEPEENPEAEEFIKANLERHRAANDEHEARRAERAGGKRSASKKTKDDE